MRSTYRQKLLVHRWGGSIWRHTTRSVRGKCLFMLNTGMELRMIRLTSLSALTRGQCGRRERWIFIWWTLGWFPPNMSHLSLKVYIYFDSFHGGYKTYSPHCHPKIVYSPQKLLSPPFGCFRIKKPPNAASSSSLFNIYIYIYIFRNSVPVLLLCFST